MSPVLSCPDRDVLHRLMLGRLRSPDSEELAQHLEDCDRCTAVVSTFRAEDTVVEAARGRGAVPAGPEGEQVRGLIEHLRRIGPPPAAAAGQTSVSGGDCTAPAGGPAENPFAFADPAEERFDFLAPPQGPGEIGRLGHYRVLRMLGQGGMGIVFEAEDVQLRRPVALKVMKPDAAAKPSARERFLREARAAAQLQHEHVVTIYQVDEAGGVPFLAMPVLNGMSLEEKLHRSGALSVPQVLRLGRHIARGLQAAHERGLVHRDIKPGNLWVEPERGGRVKILDFGLARAVEDPAHLTKSGMVVGTPAYMAPEQARGRKVDARGDLFSLGCVLYRMLTGRPPFTGRDTLAILTSLAVDTPRAPSAVNPAVPEAVSDLVMQLLSKNPAGRPASAGEVAKRLTELGASLTAPRLEALPLAEPVRPAEPSSPWAEIGVTAPVPIASRKPKAGPAFAWRPSRWHWMGAAAVLVLLALGPLGYYFGGTVVRFATNKGQVVIEVDDPDMEVTVKDNGAEIRDLTGKQVITLRAGVHVLEVTVKPGKFKPDEKFTKTFTLTRGGKEVIKVWEELAKAKSAKPPTPVSDGVPGEPISPLALVQTPVKLPGVKTWTIETKRHRGQVMAAAVSPNEKWLAMSDESGGTVRVWELATGELFRVLVGHPVQIARMAWSPDSKLLATVCMVDDYTARVWDVASGKILHSRRGVGQVAWSPDGNAIYYGAVDTGVWEWKYRSGQQPTQVLPTERVSVFSWSPDGTTLALGHGGPTGAQVTLWQRASGRSSTLTQLKREDNKGDGITALAWSPDGKILAASTYSSCVVGVWEIASGTLAVDAPALAAVAGAVGVWEAVPGKLLRSVPIKEGIVSLAWHPNGNTISVLSNGEGAIVDIDVRTDKVGPTGGGGFLGRLGLVAWLRDGPTRVAVGARSVKFGPTGVGREKRWDMHPLQRPLAWSSDGQLLAFGRETVSVWEPATGRMLWSLEMQEASGWGVNAQCAAFSPDGQVLAVGGHGEGLLQLFDARTGDRKTSLKGHTRAVRGLAWSPDGKLLASAGEDKIVRLWRAQSGNSELVGVLMDHEGPVWAVAWSPDGRRLATGGRDESVRVWDTNTQKCLHVLKGHKHEIALAWSPDGRTLVSADGQSNQVRLWDAGSGKLVRDWKAFDHFSSRTVYWSEDGKTLVTEDKNRTRFWEADTGKEHRSLAHYGLYAPGLRYMVRQSPHWGEQLWDAQAGRCLVSMVALNDKLWLALSPDGHYRGSRNIEEEIVYVVQTDKGQETLTPRDFARRFNWKNDPERVHLAQPGTSQPVKDTARPTGLQPARGALPTADPTPPEEFTALFNGKNLDGWHGWALTETGASPYDLAKLSPEEREKKVATWTADAGKHWSVENGELVNDGHGAYLATNKDYCDIELLIEYKMVPEADSGIILRSTQEVQIWDPNGPDPSNYGRAKGSGGLFNNPDGSPGRDPLVKADKPLGEWNQLRIIQVGDKATVYLNGQLVVDQARMRNYWKEDEPLPKTGKILLQPYSGEIRFRNIFVREIGPGDGAEPIKVDLKEFKVKVKNDGTPADLLGYNEGEGRLFFYVHGTATAEVQVPEDGEYTITIEASCDKANNMFAKFQLTVDEIVLAQEFELKEAAAMEYQYTAKLKKGTAKLSIEFLNDEFKEGEYDLNLYVHSVKLEKKK